MVIGGSSQPSGVAGRLGEGSKTDGEQREIEGADKLRLVEVSTPPGKAFVDMPGGRFAVVLRGHESAFAGHEDGNERGVRVEARCAIVVLDLGLVGGDGF